MSLPPPPSETGQKILLRKVSTNIVPHAKAPDRLLLSVAVTDMSNAEESIIVRQDAVQLPVRELLEANGSRLHIAEVTGAKSLLLITPA